MCQTAVEDIFFPEDDTIRPGTSFTFDFGIPIGFKGGVALPIPPWLLSELLSFVPLPLVCSLCGECCTFLLLADEISLC